MHFTIRSFHFEEACSFQLYSGANVHGKKDGTGICYEVILFGVFFSLLAKS